MWIRLCDACTAGAQDAGRPDPPDHQAHPDPSTWGCSTAQPGTASSGRSLSCNQPAHIRSKDALMSLQSQGGWHSQHQAPLSIHSQRGAARQCGQGAEAACSSQQQPADMQAAQQQPAAAAMQSQRPHHDMFPGDLTEGDSMHEQPAQQSGHWANGRSLEAEGTQGGGPNQHLPQRRSMHFARPRDALIAVQRAGSQGSHMSPFAGFAALTMARTSMEDCPDYRPGTRPKSHRMSLEQAVGRGKFIKALPPHVRTSIDAAPPVRKSLESQAPPPASSSGMRNSRDGFIVESAQQASERWTEDKRRKSLDTSQQRQPQEQVSGPGGVTATIQESPSSSSQPDELQAVTPPVDAGGAAAPTHDSHSSGLSKFSPFAASGLLNAPPFD